jgi:hypothetical protein
MNIILFLFAMPLVCGAIALYAAARNRAEERRKTAMERVAEKTKSVLLRNRSMMFPLSAILCLSSACLSASAQEIIHARAGQIVATDSTAKTLTLKVADGSMVVFKDVANPQPAISFNQDVRSKTVPAGTFNKVGAHVVVFYFGFDVPTAVAVKDLGSDAPKRTTGSVANFDRHQHLLTLKTDTTAEPQKLVLSDDTVMDTPEGVVKLADYHPNKGEQLRCFTKPESQTALFVAPN